MVLAKSWKFLMTRGDGGCGFLILGGVGQELCRAEDEGSFPADAYQHAVMAGTRADHGICGENRSSDWPPSGRWTAIG